jgi:hypothetical protein
MIDPRAHENRAPGLDTIDDREILFTAPRPPTVFFNPIPLLLRLEAEERGLWVCYVQNATAWPKVKCLLESENADYVAIATEPDKRFLVSAARWRPTRLAYQVTPEEALRQAVIWLRHRRAEEVETSPSWEAAR